MCVREIYAPVVPVLFHQFSETNRCSVAVLQERSEDEKSTHWISLAAKNITEIILT